MFNGIMDPELMKIAQEQMSRIPPEELARMQQQMMSNPDLLRMATESMKNLRPEDLKRAAEQLKHVRPEEMAGIGEKIAKSSPEELAAMKARVDAEVSYQLNAAQMLKQQGNDLHTGGQFRQAADKYLRAKNNLKHFPDPKCRTLQLQCSLNLMSCHLKLQQFEECVQEGSEILQYDANNVKALYRRGQAYRELGNLQAAVSDLNKAHKASPDDETIAAVLRETEEKLIKDGHQSINQGLIIEEIVEEENSSTTPIHQINFSEPSIKQHVDATAETVEMAARTHKPSSSHPRNSSEEKYLQTVSNNPEATRAFRDYISNSDPDSLASLSAGGMSPDMIKAATGMISKMKPEELQQMLQIAASMNGKTPGSLQNGPLATGSKFPEITPEMAKIASDRISKMAPDEVQRMIETASLLNSQPSPGQRSENVPSSSSFSSSGFLNPEVSSFLSGASTSTAGVQEQMRSTMNNPAMKQMFTSMMKNMSPEVMANMSEQFGVKLSKEEAAKAQQAISSLSPEALDRMMRWADRAQRCMDAARKAKNLLLGRQGMILAVFMLVLAFVFHQLGFVGG